MTAESRLKQVERQAAELIASFPPIPAPPSVEERQAFYSELVEQTAAGQQLPPREVFTMVLLWADKMIDDFVSDVYRGLGTKRDEYTRLGHDYEAIVDRVRQNLE